MSFFPHKFLLNIFACGLILSCPLTIATAANGSNGKSSNGKTATKEPVQKTESKLNWQNYSFPESGFSVDFPKKPERVQQTIDVPKSELKIKYETFLSEPTDSIVFVVSVWNYPSQVDMSKPEGNLQDGFGGMLSALPGSEVLNMKMATISGFKSLEFLVKNEDIYFQGKLIIVHNTLFQVFAVYKNTEDMTNNYLHFINSFKLIEPEKRKVAPPTKNGNGNAQSESKKMNI